MSFEFTGAFAVPSIQSLLETYENQFWFDRYENQIWTGVVLSGASRDAGNTNYTDILRPGLLLGRITATNKVKEWNPTGTDGSQEVFGILGPASKMQRLGANQDRWLGQIMVSGYVKPDRLIIPGNSSLGIASNASEWVIRSQMFRRFIFSDMLTGLGHSFGGWRNIVAKTADYTVTEADNNSLFTTEGASGAVIFTLPTTAKKGLRYLFYNSEDQDLTVTAAANTMIALNDVTATSIKVNTTNEKAGNSFELIGDGAKWLCICHCNPAATVTVVT
jgi:hypothetical protein